MRKQGSKQGNNQGSKHNNQTVYNLDGQIESGSDSDDSVEELDASQLEPMGGGSAQVTHALVVQDNGDDHHEIAPSAPPLAHERETGQDDSAKAYEVGSQFNPVRCYPVANVPLVEAIPVGEDGEPISDSQFQRVYAQWISSNQMVSRSANAQRLQKHFIEELRQQNTAEKSVAVMLDDRHEDSLSSVFIQDCRAVYSGLSASSKVQINSGLPGELIESLVGRDDMAHHLDSGIPSILSHTKDAQEAKGGGGVESAQAEERSHHGSEVAVDQMKELQDLSLSKFEITNSVMRKTSLGLRIERGKFHVYSDNNGQGRNFHVLPGGHKLTLAQTQQMLAPVPEVPENGYDNGVEAHIEGRFSILTIQAGQRGFCCLRTETSQLFHLPPGRYFLNHDMWIFLGRIDLTQRKGNQLLTLTDRDNQQLDRASGFKPTLQVQHQWRKQISVLFQPLNHRAILCQQSRMMTTAAEKPVYFTSGDVTLQGCGSLNDSMVSSIMGRLNTYSVVTLTNPSELIVLKHRGRSYVIPFDPSSSGLNTYYINPVNFELHEGKIFNMNEEAILTTDMRRIILNDNQRLAFVDEDSQFKMGRVSSRQSVVLRSPIQVIETIEMNQDRYQFPDSPISRVVVGASEMAVVYDAVHGRVSLMPRLKDVDGMDRAYYFHASYRQYLGMFNQAKPGVQTHQVPGIGEIVCLNVQSDQLAAVSCNGKTRLLKHRDAPYIISPPDRFLSLHKASEPYIHVNEVHRVILQSNQISGVDVDGSFELLDPSDMTSDRNYDGKGVKIYAANSTFKKYPTYSRHEPNITLGPLQMFTVPAGQVGYIEIMGSATGADGQPNNDGFRLVQPGRHCLDTRKNNEIFRHLYPTTIPAESLSVEVQNFKDNCTVKIEAMLSIDISDPVKAIKKFKDDFDGLKKFLSGTASAALSDVCAGTSAIKSASTVEGIHAQVVKKLQEYNDYGVSVSHFEIVSYEPDPAYIKTMKANARLLQEQESRNKITQAQEQGKLDVQLLRAQQAQSAISAKASQENLSITVHAKNETLKLTSETAIAVSQLALTRQQIELETAKNELSNLGRQSEAKIKAFESMEAGKALAANAESQLSAQFSLVSEDKRNDVFTQHMLLTATAAVLKEMQPKVTTHVVSVEQQQKANHMGFQRSVMMASAMRDPSRLFDRSTSGKNGQVMSFLTEFDPSTAAEEPVAGK